MQQLWIPEKPKTTVCIDSYEDGIFQGRFYGPDRDVQTFCSLSQFLVMMEHMLEQTSAPQSDTTRRSVSALLQQSSCRFPRSSIPRGKMATFELQILFRQHTSWQGVIVWLEKQWERSFRSVLELVFLMDSALRYAEGSGAL